MTPQPKDDVLSWWVGLDTSAFYATVKRKQDELSASTFGKISGKPILGPDTATTQQVKRWRPRGVMTADLFTSEASA